MNLTLHDEKSERFCVALTLFQRRESLPDPLHFLHPGRRSLFLAGALLGQRGYLHSVARFGDPGEIWTAVNANVAIVAEVVERAGTYDVAGDPRDELRWCVSVCTTPENGDFHRDRLRVLYERREKLLALESEMQRLLAEAA